MDSAPRDDLNFRGAEDFAGFRFVDHVAGDGNQTCRHAHGQIGGGARRGSHGVVKRTGRVFFESRRDDHLHAFGGKSRKKVQRSAERASGQHCRASVAVHEIGAGNADVARRKSQFPGGPELGVQRQGASPMQQKIVRRRAVFGTGTGAAAVDASADFQRNAADRFGNQRNGRAALEEQPPLRQRPPNGGQRQYGFGDQTLARFDSQRNLHFHVISPVLENRIFFLKTNDGQSKIIATAIPH